MSSADLVFAALIEHVRGEVRRNEPLANRTSVRVGGTADLFVRPKDGPDLARCLRLATDLRLPLHILGGGANTLVSDEGLRGVVLRLPTASTEQVEREEGAVRVTLGAGAPIAKLIDAMRKNAVSGAEFLAGVPGTIGGAVAMNAGTRHGWTQTVLHSVELATAEGVRTVAASELQFEYRHTHLPEDSVLWSATFRLPLGDVAASEAKMAEDLAYRRRTQPLSLPNSGSVFKNPPNGGAGRLIEEAGLKGLREGGAQISELHANFIVNRGGAKANEVLALIRRAQREVLAKAQVALEPEVKLVGAFPE